jgi:hypothetical protein
MSESVNKTRLLPCKTCPWRKNRDSSTIPGYNQEKAENLLHTVGEGDAFRSVMACHHSTDENTFACNGYLAKEGWHNLNVRLLLISEKINNPTQVLEACEEAGIELEPDYYTVLEKLRRSEK